MVVALSLLAACSGTDCGAKTELKPGDPCGDRLFTYCPEGTVCCVSGGSPSSICTQRSQCRCDDGKYACAYPQRCQDGRCVCAPFCSGTSVCWRNESVCLYDCCWGQERCVSGWCFAPAPDLRLPRRDARRDGPRDAAVDRRRDAARDLRDGEPGDGHRPGADGG